MLFGVLILYNIDALPLDQHQWRQTQTLSVARNFYFGHWNILMPEMDINNNQPFVLLEFPIYQYLLALLWKVFGFSYVIGRLYTVGLMVLTSWMIGKIAEYVLGRSLRFWGHLLLVIPMAVFWSRTFMIDIMVLFALVGVVYSLVETDRRQNPNFLWLFTGMLSLLFLIKPNILIVPFLYCLYFFLSRPYLRRSWLKLTAASAVALGLGTCWFLHAKAVNASNPHFYSAAGIEWFWGTLVLIKDPWTYQTMGWRILINCGGALALIALVPGIISKRTRAVSLLAILCLVAYFYAAPNLNLNHTYYQLPMLFPIVLATILGLEELFSSLPNSVNRYLVPALKLMVSVSCIWTLQSGWYEIGFPTTSPYSMKPNASAAKKINAYFEANQIDNKTALVKNVAICELRSISYEPHSILFLINARGIFISKDECPGFLAKSAEEFDYIFVLDNEVNVARQLPVAFDNKRKVLITM